MVYLHELTVTERAFAAGVNGPFDLPVNPVSFLLLHVRGDAGVSAPDFQQLLGTIVSLTVSFKGTTIIQGSGQDLARLVSHVWGMSPNIEGFNAVSPALVSFTLTIPFGRKPFWKNEAFPATRRGEFTITIERQVTPVNLSNLQFALESVQLLEAEPTQFLKMVSLTRQISSGDPDFELPIGNPFVGIQVFSPVAMANAPISETLRRVRLLLDNVEFNIGDSAFDVMRQVGMFRGGDFNDYSAITSRHRNYMYLEFDPLKDDEFMVPTEGRASVRLRFTSDVAGSPRVIPVEMVKLPGAGGAA